MNGNTESTSNSMKFAPMPISTLLANLMPLQAQEDSPDCSSGSGDESDNSFRLNTTKKSSPITNKTTSKFMTPTVNSQSIENNKIKAFASEKKPKNSDYDKENNVEKWLSNRKNHQDHNTHKDNVNSIIQKNQYLGIKLNNTDVDKENNVKKLVTNQKFPKNDEQIQEYVHKNNTNSDIPVFQSKKRNVLEPQNKNVDISNSSHKKSPESVKVVHKTKISTPKIKSGIRKFTPSSVSKSRRKTPQKILIQNNRDKVRCELFSQKQQDELNHSANAPSSSQIVQVPVPETPMNLKPMPASYLATPSYPQGISGHHNSKVLFKTTRIKDKKYMFIKKLGMGGSSEVFKVLEVGTSNEYAVKCVYLSSDEELAQGYINEVRLLRELQKSDRVITLYDYEYDQANQFLRMVLEVGETDLSSFLKARGAGLPPALVLYYWQEMLHAVHCIHENGVIHADLKPANFLLVSGRLKLIDFGIASAISSDATSVVRAQAAGTYSYISPEALVGGAGGPRPFASDAPHKPIKISFYSDVWSLGCILYSMVYGRTPFGNIPNLAKLATILDPNHHIDYPPVDHLPPSLIASLKWCLTYNARERPSVAELLAVPLLAPPRALPPALLHKLQPHVSPEELRLLKRARY